MARSNTERLAMAITALGEAYRQAVTATTIAATKWA